MRAVAMVVALVFAARPAHAQSHAIDTFESFSAWKVMPSDGVKASVHVVEGAEGNALRLEYNFEAGSGFVVLRREVPTELREVGDNFRFTFRVRGSGPRNNLEFKLVDPSGDNVWWLNQRAFEWPREWTLQRIPARRVEFAWGPLGASSPNPRPRSLGFIEFAIAASEGGKGSVDLDSLTYEALPSAAPVVHEPTFSVLSKDEVDIDLGQSREFGGLILDWDEDAYPTDYDVLSSEDGEHLEAVATVRGARGGKRFVPIQDGQGKALRLTMVTAARPPRLHAVEVPPVEFGSSLNAMFAEMSRRVRSGRLPRYFRGEQNYWTVVGVPADRDEALINTDGAIEIATSGFSIEPFLGTDIGLVSWADAELSQSLAEGYLPIPTVRWRVGELELNITAFADGEPGSSVVVGRYVISNHGNAAAKGSLVLAIRPFQVLPPWQALNITGGVTAITEIERSGDWVRVNGQDRVRAISPVGAWGASRFAAGDVVERWDIGVPSSEGAVTDPLRLASGALRFDYDIAPGASAEFAVEAVLRPSANPPMVNHLSVADRQSAAAGLWTELLNKVHLTLPRSAQRITDTFRTTQAYILINQDGPAIQPGSRSYERSWMRDGSMTGAALLETGHPEDDRRFIEWFASFQYPGGKVPCVVDRRGPDPVPEHDSHGQLVYAIWNYFRFTGDRAFLERMWPHIAAAVDYIDSLRRQRMTDEFRRGTPENRAKYGLVPESISHEGYSAKPMHSYWDSFFVVKGLSDAASAALELGKSDEARRIGAMRDEYRAALYASMRLAITTKGIDYIPGCVELGDFDATSTAIGLYPCGELPNMPRAELDRTFDKYFAFFASRRDGLLRWKDYTPYELRIVGTFIRLGQPERAHALLDYFFKDQRPAAWNQWAEVVCPDPKTPRFLGDMPHTWVGSEFLHAVRSCFVYEEGESLVMGAGIKPEWPWEDQGVGVEGFPTEHGVLNYTLRGDGDVLKLEVGPGIQSSPEPCVFVLPPGTTVLSVTSDNPSVEAVLNERADGGGPVRVRWDGGPARIEFKVRRSPP